MSIWRRFVRRSFQLVLNLAKLGAAEEAESLGARHLSKLVWITVLTEISRESSRQHVGDLLSIWCTLSLSVTTSGVSMTLGDTVAQTVELSRSNKPLVWSNYDRTRTAIACGWNTLLFTPLFFVWFRRLDRWFPGTSLTTVLKKVSLNQCVVAVPVNAGFLTYTTSLEQLLGNKKFNPSKVVDRVETQLTEDLPGLFLRSCMLWFPVNMLNFLYVPATFRVVPTIIVSTVWSVHMSLTAHRHGESGGKSKQEGQEIQVRDY